MCGFRGRVTVPRRTETGRRKCLGETSPDTEVRRPSSICGQQNVSDPPPCPHLEKRNLFPSDYYCLTEQSVFSMNQ